MFAYVPVSDPQAEPAAPVVKVYAIVVRVVENILLKSRSVGPRTPVQTAYRVEGIGHLVFVYEIHLPSLLADLSSHLPETCRPDRGRAVWSA